MIRLQPEPSSVTEVRRYVRLALDGLVADPAVVVLVASELATNVVIHARTPYSVSVRIIENALVRLEVTDGTGVENLAARAQEERQTGGWGLQAVELMSIRWGFEEHAEGKTVWAEIQAESRGERQGR